MKRGRVSSALTELTCPPRRRVGTPGVSRCSCGSGSLTDEADDAADERVEITVVPRHDGLLLSQESLPGRFHHVHGHLSDEDLHANSREGGRFTALRRKTQKQKKRGRNILLRSGSRAWTSGSQCGLSSAPLRRGHDISANGRTAAGHSKWKPAACGGAGCFRTCVCVCVHKMRLFSAAGQVTNLLFSLLLYQQHVYWESDWSGFLSRTERAKRDGLQSHETRTWKLWTGFNTKELQFQTFSQTFPLVDDWQKILQISK